MNEDRTNSTRQQRRRLHEKEWLAGHGWSSWESLHTALMNGSARLAGEGKLPATAEQEPGIPPRDPARTIKFQWKPDEAAGEKVGKRLEIRLLTEGSFHRFIRGTLPPGTAGNLPEYLSRYPGNTHYAVTWGEGIRIGAWRVPAGRRSCCGSCAMPPGRWRWAAFDPGASGEGG